MLNLATFRRFNVIGDLALNSDDGSPVPGMVLHISMIHSYTGHSAVKRYPCQLYVVERVLRDRGVLDGRCSHRTVEMQTQRRREELFHGGDTKHLPRSGQDHGGL